MQVYIKHASSSIVKDDKLRAPKAAVLMQVLQLQWHFKEFFFLTAVGLITFLASALVLWSNVRASQMAAVPTALSSGYMTLLIYIAVR